MEHDDCSVDSIAPLGENFFGYGVGVGGTGPFQTKMGQGFVKRNRCEGGLDGMQRHVGQEAALTVQTDAGWNRRRLGSKFKQVFTQLKKTQASEHASEVPGNLCPILFNGELHTSVEERLRLALCIRVQKVWV